MRKFFLIILIANLSFLFAAMGDDSLELANKFKNEGNYIEAVKYYEFSANEGNAQAQYIIGDIYLYGKFNSRVDPLQAKYYLDLSAEQNDKDALITLGKMYFDGNKAAAAKKDYKISKDYFEKASNLYSDKEAQYYLGLFYFKGLKTKKDVEKAKELFLKSCDQKYNSACDVLRDKYKIIM